MRLLKQALAVLGAVVVFAVAAAIVTPKKVHALVATLVQVSNTVEAPAITEGVPSLASQHVTIYCPVGALCQPIGPGGTFSLSAPDYTVPAGQNLVITSIDITSPGGGGGPYVYVLQGLSSTSTIGQAWYVPNNGQTVQFQFPSGIVWPAGGAIFSDGNDGVIGVIRGYLTPN
jgi:hypothetical protein